MSPPALVEAEQAEQAEAGGEALLAVATLLVSAGELRELVRDPIRRHGSILRLDPGARVGCEPCASDSTSHSNGCRGTRWSSASSPRRSSASDGTSDGQGASVGGGVVRWGGRGVKKKKK